MKIYKTYLLSICFAFLFIAAQAAERRPVSVELNNKAKLTVAEALSWYKQNHFSQGLSFRFLNSLKDDLGYTHYRYIETYNGIDIHSTMWIVHAKGGFAESMNGMVVETLPVNVKPNMKEAEALTKAMRFMNAQSYKWQMPEEEQFIKEMTRNINATWYPKATLYWVSSDINNDNLPFRLSYCFDIYAQKPLSRKYVFVDAQTGVICFSLDRLHTSGSGKVKDTAKTMYSGQRIISANALSSTKHILDDSTRGAHIKTLNMKTGTTYGSAVDFVNKGSFWFDSNAVFDEYATDAHWATEMTWDFYKKTFNRNSVDNAGHPLYSYVHYSTGYFNAFWDGNEMTYGDGTGQPLTALDVTGHEISHGVTQYTAALNYINESGALNEGFSDCMGKSVEYFARPGKFSWPISDDFSPAFRDMSNPKSLKQANTYKGTYWYTGTADNGGVHQNNSILTYWYYLICEGGSGTNDNGNSYNINRLGIDSAQQILYRAQSVYNVPSTQYKDARTNTIKAATDLYGACSPAVRQVTNAWYAVGVGDSFISRVISIPAVDNRIFCRLPAVANFSSLECLNANTYKWYFGDGDSSSLSNPIHTYLTAGIYNVRLKADGGKCGSADSTISGLITISVAAGPVAKNDTLCGSGSGRLSVLLGGNNFYLWYDSMNALSPLDTGVNFTTPAVTSTTTFYVEEGQRAQFMNPIDTTFGTGSFFNSSSTHGLIFNALSDFTLKSVLVYADLAGAREIDLLDSSGNIINSITTTIPIGGGRITLNMHVPKGNNYFLSLNSGTNTDLYRTRTGASYPYTLPGIVSITDKDLPTGTSGKSGYYYFFYNWEVIKHDCRSARTPVSVVLTGSALKAHIKSSGATTFCLGNSVTLIADSGTSYKWNTGDTTRSIVVHHSGVYNVQLLKAGCHVTSSSDTINVLSIPIANITPHGETKMCLGHTLAIKVDASNQYKWNTGDTTQIIHVSKPGRYTVIVNNGYCSSLPDSVTVDTISAPLANATAVRTGEALVVKFTNKSTNANLFNWYLEGGAVYSTVTDTFSYYYSGGYPKAGYTVVDTVMLVAVNAGCTDTFRIPINYSWYNNGIATLNNYHFLSLYPNPASSSVVIHIQSFNNDKMILDVLDITGKSIKHMSVKTDTNKAEDIVLNTEHFANGIYMLRLTQTDGQFITKRLIIQH